MTKYDYKLKNGMFFRVELEEVDDGITEVIIMDADGMIVDEGLTEEFHNDGEYVNPLDICVFHSVLIPFLKARGIRGYI